MKVIRGVGNLAKVEGTYPVVTLGNFDGLHKGHQSVIENLLKRRDAVAGGTCILCTFDPHPFTILPDKQAPGLLLEFDRKVEILSNMGVDIVVCVDFTEEFSSIGPEEFVRDILVDKIGVREIFVGSGFAFGKGGRGGIKDLKSLGRSYGFNVFPVEKCRHKGRVISSSLVRKQLSCGAVHEVTDLLGRHYSISGLVIKGEGRGRGLGFPTANLSQPVTMLPGDGIYAIRAKIEKKLYNSVLYIGTQPTFVSEEDKHFVEVHIPGVDIDLYGSTVEVTFVRRLRGDRKFNSREELIQQVKRDIQESEEILSQE